MKETTHATDVSAEIEQLRRRLQEAEETIEAIRTGAVDAVVVNTPDGEKIYTLEGADRTYRLLIEQMNESALTLARDGTILYANGRFAHLLERPLEHVIGASLFTFVHDADHPLVEAVLREADERPHQREIRIEGSGDAVIPAHLSVSRFELEPQQQVYAAIITDLTSQKRNEQIAATEVLSRSILEQTAEAIVVLDNEGRIVQASRGAHSLCGENPMLKPFAEAFPLSQPDGSAFEIDPARYNGSIRGAEARMICSNSLIADVIVSLSALKDHEGQRIGAVVTMTDISERKQSEKELSRLTSELERRVMELQQANKELEAFSYSVSHDLRQPLRALEGYSEILLEDYEERLDEEGKEILRSICWNSERMAELITNLLHFSRFSRQSLTKSTVNMTSVARSVWEETVSAEIAGAIRFHIGELPPAFGDAAMIRQVFSNLISNAVKYTRQREKRVVEIGSTTNGNDEIVYFVRDNGIGFDMRYVEKLFGVFKRLHSDSEYEGTGVGLAIVKRILDRHNGHVWAEGKPEEGATFYFTLPPRIEK